MGSKLPAYTVRVHPRARRVRIRVSAHEGVVVTLPPRVPKRVAEQALAAREEWVRAALARVAPRREALLAAPEALLPEEVAFPATGERWRVSVSLADGGRRASVREREGELLVDAPHAADALSALRRWLTRAARERLLPMLAEAAEAQGISYERASVRCQRSRWGSRSSSGAISLNRNLLFLQPEETLAVILHELCHAIHHNHSPAFWRELQTLDPGARVHKEALRGAAERVPAWAQPEARA